MRYIVYSILSGIAVIICICMICTNKDFKFLNEHEQLVCACGELNDVYYKFCKSCDDNLEVTGYLTNIKDESDSVSIKDSFGSWTNYVYAMKYLTLLVLLATTCGVIFICSIMNYIYEIKLNKRGALV